ncbi:PepSY-associated TM helix domain-containing protein [Ectopseudomonas mendocina]|uniref:PepSY-associated TM helix domain-containing protein n=1 Tax=Ectopseudomonas mendocina TaxID=300 RepID=A0ABZ2RBD3_ECTME
MKHNITQSLSWLHTWSGLVFGWALVAIFLTGTLAVFDKEINLWMQPEVPTQTVDREQAVATAIKHLRTHHADESSWQVALPSERSPRLAVSAGEQQGGGGGRGNAMTVLDPATGEVITPRQTAGGNFFFRFHYTLHFPRNIGIWVVGFMAMAMLAAIVSGIVIHKKFFKEFFTFRPNKGQRSWLDYHNASGVLLLPFHIMITYTGLVIFFLIYMPAPMDALFDGDRQAYQAAMRGDSTAGAQHQGERGAQRQQGGRGEQGAGGQRGQRQQRQQAERVPLMDRTDDIDFMALIARAEADLGSLSGFNLKRSANGDAVFEGRPVLGNVIELTKGRSMSLNALTGEVIRPAPDSVGATLVQRVLAGLHFAQFGGYPMRWVYFICGMISTAMMAGGLILFTVKRRRRYAKESRPARSGYAFIERVNIAIVAGLMIACVGMLWANRLLPVELTARPNAEVNAFFALWGLSFVHTSLRPWMQAWREQLWVGALLMLALPLANALNGLPLLGNGIGLYVELTTMAMGALVLLAALRTGQGGEYVSDARKQRAAKEELAC